ncbi:fungal-specific transcription factor domain-containing protein [Macrophomina phaseolina]|uniref:Fungal-specific transcription factor domain-containing protein n=1 Tax=Macrophomina phaseolina TaxID=35725 RepID=A0ABQ8GJ93_9PEZI|nr:fungal-specific transcription factor domain-containing protein [Macrophomina phaseolina]
MPRPRNRTFTGCWKCRSRKVKCDEAKPACNNCQRIGAECSGFAQKFIWVEADSHVQQSDGRRALHCESTWAGFPTLSPDLVDLLVAQCDENYTRDSALGPLQPVQHNPFFTFAVAPPCALKAGAESEVELPLDLQIDSSVDLGMNCFAELPIQDSSAQLQVVSSAELGMDSLAGLAVSFANQTPHALEAFPDTTPAERSLFHHYVSHVAAIMMPYEHARNPWKLHYPAVARGRTFPDQAALYHAMLSQAAFNISNLRAGDDAMAATGCRHYAAAIRQLMFVIGDNVNDFGALLASIMTLVFAETYCGESRKWRHHLQGAWELFEQYRACEPWKVTDFVCISIQSLNIIKIISETSNIAGSRSARNTVRINERSGDLGAIMSTFDFGFTIGASPAILKCIAGISEFRKAGKGFGDVTTEAFLEETLAQLNICLRDTLGPMQQIPQQEETSREDEDAKHLHPSHAQRISFVYATYIYLYRTILNVPPQTVKDYVSRVFDNVSTFYACSCGNFSIWPAFMAAVEATTDTDIVSAREWLAWATSFGLGNRASVRRIVEEVWERRETQSRLSGIAQGMVAIEWRDVMQELDCDVLLI